MCMVYKLISINRLRGGYKVRKFLQMLSATAVIGLALSTAAVSADSVTCGNISDTGAGSTNTVKCMETQ
jgi:hypothetical protein